MAYTVTGRIGRGGMGVVDLATDEQGNQFALKRLVLHGSVEEMSDARHRIRREAEVLAQLDHPGIVRLIDVIDEDDDVILVMPYLSGGTLAEHVQKNGPLSPSEVLDLGDQILRALSAAHRQGVIHRDIKPANIIFDENGKPHLTDFGAAIARDATAGLTMAGMVVGTPEYMSPEQAKGLHAGPESDIFSLGATLRFAATGSPPFGRGDAAIIIQRAAKGQVDPWPRGTDRALRRRLSPMLRTDPTKRPSAATLVGGPSGTEVMKAPQHRRRSILLASSIAAVAIMMAGATTLFFAFKAPSKEIASASTTNSSTEPEEISSPTTPCQDLPYQPCGQPSAPFTDGMKCLANHADYDGDSRNGCEAAPDNVDGTILVDSITANLVPDLDTDSYPFKVFDKFQLLCDGSLKVTLTAPMGVSMRLEIIDGTQVIGTTVSSDGAPSTVALVEPSCMGDDTVNLIARVSWVGNARSAEPYVITRSGSF